LMLTSVSASTRPGDSDRCEQRLPSSIYPTPNPNEPMPVTWHNGDRRIQHRLRRTDFLCLLVRPRYAFGMGIRRGKIRLKLCESSERGLLDWRISLPSCPLMSLRLSPFPPLTLATNCWPKRSLGDRNVEAKDFFPYSKIGRFPQSARLACNRLSLSSK